MVKITAFAGATFSLSLTCQDDGGSAVDLTGYSARGEVRRTSTNPAVVLDLSPTIPTPANGIVTISVSDETTTDIAAGDYVFDVVLDTPTGEVIPILRASLRFDTLVTKV